VGFLQISCRRRAQLDDRRLRSLPAGDRRTAHTYPQPERTQRPYPNIHPYAGHWSGRGTPTTEIGGVLWEGIITSDTECQYKHNGITLNTCDTYWETQFALVVGPSGNVHGNREADLQNLAKCTPHSLAGNSERIFLNLAGKADEKAFHFTLSNTSISPNP
jgi:hypothetical protein